MNRFLKIGGVFQALGLQAPVDAILSPPSAWAANVQVFFHPGSNSLSLSAKGIKGVSPDAVVTWLGLNNIVNGGGGAAAIDLSGNALPADQVDALVSYLANYGIGLGFSSLNLSGGTTAAPTPQSLHQDGIGSITGGNGDPLGTTGTAYLLSYDGGITLSVYNWIETNTTDTITEGLMGGFPNPITDDTVQNPILMGTSGPLEIGLSVTMTQLYVPYLANASVLALVAGGVSVTTN